MANRFVLLCFSLLGLLNLPDCEAIREKRKEPIKTLKLANGDVIDCIDVYSQPAFDHPSLSKHKIRMLPSSLPKSNNNFNISTESVRSVGIGGRRYCPEGSIPILRPPTKARSRYLQDEVDIPPPGSGLPGLNNSFLEENGTFHGASGGLTSWNPVVSYTLDFSAVKLTLMSGVQDLEPKREIFNSAQAGWIVNEQLYGDKQTRTFIYWTQDGFMSTGCYNLQCAGFIQTSPDMYLGEMISLSIFGGVNRVLSVQIFKDTAQSWWLVMAGAHIGYWPAEIFTTMADLATKVQWGAEVYRAAPVANLQTTQMGNGHFTFEGLYKSCSISSLQVINVEDQYVDPENTMNFANEPNCYDSTPMTKSDPVGYYVLVGGAGPGHVPNCYY